MFSKTLYYTPLFNNQNQTVLSTLVYKHT